MKIQLFFMMICVNFLVLIYFLFFPYDLSISLSGLKLPLYNRKKCATHHDRTDNSPAFAEESGEGDKVRIIL
ncbi:hypothetical protein CSW98_08385 [Vibrio sp. HA2012]|uniref:hypothetical protein n=1 Tax=Vibrio sp. HA2012 TaxID=1971595 RepID=UPI000C2B5B0D|nr:hypothetical protein [Vibrio sp. HA2012]PJC86987.1 hypothetical protein CSW98_08385 [Vibrio sp. HA2012]